MESSSPFIEHYEFVDVLLPPFLFQKNRKHTVESALSKRRQEASSEESGAPMAKPKPRSRILVMMKPRSISLVPRNYFSRDLSDSESPGTVEVGPDIVRTGIWKQKPHTSPYPTEQSQEWRPESTQEERVWKQDRESKGEGSWKQEQRGQSSHSTCHWKQGQNVGRNKIETDSGSVRTPMHHYLGNIHQYVQKKLELTDSSIKELGSTKTNIMIW